MASGDVVGIIYAIIPPASLYATPDVRLGGSPPNESFPVWDFDDSALEHLDLFCVLSPTYSGNGLTIQIVWSATSATSNNVVWNAAIRRIADDVEDADASHVYNYNASFATAPNVSGEVSYDNITFLSGSEMDGLVAGEHFVLRIRRNATSINDTMVGDAELWSLVIKET